MTCQSSGTDIRLATAVMEEQLVAENIEHIGCPQPSLEEDGFPTAVSLVRDAEVYVEAFVGHYRSLGCRRIVMLDNGSSDRTVQIAGAAPEVTLMRCGLPFDRFKRAMRRYLTRAYCIHAGAFTWTSTSFSTIRTPIRWV